ncbi:MAG: hypothetical protein V1819_00780 [bacterium]
MMKKITFEDKEQKGEFFLVVSALVIIWVLLVISFMPESSFCPLFGLYRVINVILFIFFGFYSSIMVIRNSYKKVGYVMLVIFFLCLTFTLLQYYKCHLKEKALQDQRKNQYQWLDNPNPASEQYMKNLLQSN